ncbi:type II toxin-antitoxin system Phd/YefM family antitoxin [Geomonas oryzae]|uniref:type II toxin-antitoxin system Phd/YefM family antitoxin n=1 Tax=Geomonas oryzae TaxID=2364273 RepID=UPI00100B60EC|nr:type II toxin-antitoxin system Phd/YefM family antitoxin [Geomonas oryzae]
MPSINEEEIEANGITALEAALMTETTAIISVHGKGRFVVMHLDHFLYLKECELEAALAQNKEDIAAGRFVISSTEEHLKRLKEGNLP